MSLTQVTEFNRELYVILRLIKVKLFNNIEIEQKYFVNLKGNTQEKNTHCRLIKKKTIKYLENHLFTLKNDSHIKISLNSNRFFFKNEEIGSNCVKPDLELKKNTDWIKLFKAGNEVGKILISYLVGDKSEFSDKLKTLQELELEKEEVKFFKLNYLKKLENLKKVKSAFRFNACKIVGIMQEKLKFHCELGKNTSCMFKEIRIRKKNKARFLSSGL